MAERAKLPWRVNGNAIWSDDGYVAELSCPRGPDARDLDAAFIVKAVNNHEALVAALKESRAALIAFKDAVEASGKTNGREYVGLGIQINEAVGHAWNALAAVGGVTK